MNILVDIGGTYVRFGVEEKGQSARVQKYLAKDFSSFEDALQSYCDEESIKNPKALLIALAAHEGVDGVWRFVNRNSWEIDPAALNKKGWRVEVMLNDFEAATWGLVDLKDKEQKILKEGVKDFSGGPRALIGPGTGLGLGYLIPLSGGGYHVQATLGGHMPSVALTDEQRMIIQTVERVKERKCAPVFEDVVSGPGLVNIYKAVCLIQGKKPKGDSAAELLENYKDSEAVTTFRLFHEFFGLFAATVAVTANAYGGIYLTGGMLDRLIKKDLFNFPQFEKLFVIDLVPSVKHALDSTKIVYVQEPDLSFKGLIASKKS